MQLVDSLFMTNSDLLYLSFPGSLEYIVCKHYKSLFVLPIYYIHIYIYIYILIYYYESKTGFVFLAFTEIYMFRFVC